MLAPTACDRVRRKSWVFCWVARSLDERPWRGGSSIRSGGRAAPADY